MLIGRQQQSRVIPLLLLLLRLLAVQIWGQLTRQQTAEVVEAPQLHTMIPVPNPFVIPGERFREVGCPAIHSKANAMLRLDREVRFT